MDVLDLLHEKREDILRIARAHHATNVRIFGSAARGEADEASDIDFLVEFAVPRGLLDYAAFVRELETLLGRKVDVVSEKGLRARLRERVLREARVL